MSRPSPVPGGRPAGRSRLCGWGAVLWAAALLCSSAAGRAALAAPPGAAERSALAQARLGFIAQLYAERDDFRAESEILAFLHDFPEDPLRPQVELVRAKLYYRAGRLAEADAMLISLVDRYREGAAAEDARLLLGFSWLRQGRLAEAAPLLAGEPPLDPLREAPPYDAGRAAAWSTALPGAGFFSLGEGGRGATALGLDLAFLAGTVIAYQQHNVPVALISFTVAAALYSGGREAVREEAGRLNDRWLDARREAWLARSSEPRLMAVAFDLKF